MLYAISNHCYPTVTELGLYSTFTLAKVPLTTRCIETKLGSFIVGGREFIIRGPCLLSCRSSNCHVRDPAVFKPTPIFSNRDPVRSIPPYLEARKA